MRKPSSLPQEWSEIRHSSKGGVMAGEIISQRFIKWADNSGLILGITAQTATVPSGTANAANDHGAIFIKIRAVFARQDSLATSLK